MPDIEGMTLEGEGSSLSTATDQGIVTPETGSAQAATGSQAAAEPEIDPQWSPGAQERIQALIAERNELRASAATAATYEPWKGLVDHLQNDGYQSFDEFQTKQAQINAEQTTRNRISQDLQRVGRELNDRVNNGYIDPATGERQYLDLATAERMFELEKSNAIATQDRAAQAERLARVELDTLAAKPEYAKMDRDYVLQMAQAQPGRPLAQIAKDSHDREVRREQDVIARYNAGAQQRAAATSQTPNGGGGAAKVETGMPPTDPTQFRAWLDAQIAANGGYGK